MTRHLGSDIMPTTPPHYTRVVDDIKRRVSAGELSPGDKLPSTAELMKQYHVSSTVIRNAMLQLRTEGVVTGYQGKGVYIAER